MNAPSLAAVRAPSRFACSPDFTLVYEAPPPFQILRMDGADRGRQERSAQARPLRPAPGWPQDINLFGPAVMPCHKKDWLSNDPADGFFADFSWKGEGARKGSGRGFCRAIPKENRRCAREERSGRPGSGCARTWSTLSWRTRGGKPAGSRAEVPRITARARTSKGGTPVTCSGA